MEVVWARVEGCSWWPGEVWCHTAKCIEEKPYEIRSALSSCAPTGHRGDGVCGADHRTGFWVSVILSVWTSSLSEGKLLVVFFNGNTHGWVNAGSLDTQMRLMVEDTEVEMVK